MKRLAVLALAACAFGCIAPRYMPQPGWTREQTNHQGWGREVGWVAVHDGYVVTYQSGWHVRTALFDAEGRLVKLLAHHH